MAKKSSIEKNKHREALVKLYAPKRKALLATAKSLRAGGRPSAEESPVPSRIYAPSGFVPVPAERELEKEWAQAVPPRARSPAAASACTSCRTCTRRTSASSAAPRCSRRPRAS